MSSFVPESGHVQRRDRWPLSSRRRHWRPVVQLPLCGRQSRLHEIEAVTVEDCWISEGITLPPRLDSDRGIDLQHFLHFCLCVGWTAEPRIGDRQEQVGVTECCVL